MTEIRNFFLGINIVSNKGLYMLMLRKLLPVLAAIACAPLPSASAQPRSSVAMHGEPRNADGIAAYSYVNPDAPKGGRLTLGVQGSFETTNPFIVAGVPASGIREFVVESLMSRSLDEPFSLYGLIAETIDIADDQSKVTFALNPAARFSNGAPVTADDVIASFAFLKTKGRPNHRTYFTKVSKAEKTASGGVTFYIADPSDRELPLILALMPVFPKTATADAAFSKPTMSPMIGSGPYTISNVDAGRSISFKRNPDYWGRNLPVNRGRFNFDAIRFDYYRDGIAMFEAFKRGQIDLRLEEDPGRWAGGYNFDAMKDGRCVKRAFDIGLPAGMGALVFNTRRAVFSDPLVRRALIQLFDAEWTNRTLYFDLFKRTESYFARSYLASTGRPADATERKLLSAFPDAVRPGILDGTFRFPVTDGSGQNRQNQRAAFDLLKRAGYTLRGGRLVKSDTGAPLSFEILAANGSQETLLLSFARSVEPLGITARLRLVDSAQYQQRLNSFDYDMIQSTWPSSLSPGNEQLFRWSKATATSNGSFNFAGVRSDAVDAMIHAMLAAESEDNFNSSVRALDRVLLSGDYVVPLFHSPRQWVAYWAHLKQPAKTPLFGYALDTWWTEDGK